MCKLKYDNAGLGVRWLACVGIVGTGEIPSVVGRAPAEHVPRFPHQGIFCCLDIQARRDVPRALAQVEEGDSNNG